MDRDYNGPGPSSASSYPPWKSSDNAINPPSRTTSSNGNPDHSKPLKIMTDMREVDNGHSQPTDNTMRSSAPYNLLQESFTRSALQAVHPGAAPTSNPIGSVPSSSSTIQPSPFGSPQSGPRGSFGRIQELNKRRSVMDRVDRLKDNNALDIFIPQVEGTTSTQISMNVRRFAKRETKQIPIKMRNFINDSCSTEAIKPPSITKTLNNKNVSKYVPDPDETDYSDLEDEDDQILKSTASSSNSTWCIVKRKFIVNDLRLQVELEENEKLLEDLELKLVKAKEVDLWKVEWLEEESKMDRGCARCIPWMRKERKVYGDGRGMKINPLYTLNGHPKPSIYSEKDVRLINVPNIGEATRQYAHRISEQPSFTCRKNLQTSIWCNRKALDEEKTRNGMKKKEEKEKREKRKAERMKYIDEEGLDDVSKSDSYEDTDDESADDDDYTPQPETVGKRDRSSNGNNKKKRKRDYDKERERRIARKAMRDGTQPSKLGGGGSVRRGSTQLGSSQSLRISSSSRPSFDCDLVFEPTVPQNIVYKEIEVPSFTLVEEDPVDLTTITEEEYGTGAIMEKVASLHHKEEFKEKKKAKLGLRGNRYRTEHTHDEFNVSSSSEDDPDMPPFDYNIVEPLSNHERISNAKPYPKRSFDP